MTTLPEIYARIADALAADASLEEALIEDFDGTLKSRFGIAVQGYASLARSNRGFRLDWNGRSYEISDPRNADRTELNDEELELVSGGGDCGSSSDDQNNANRSAAYANGRG